MSKTTVRAVRQALERLPPDLDCTYDAALQRIDRQNDDDRHLANKVLLWISNSIRPLSVSELREALAVEPGTTVLDTDSLPDADVILSVCAGLVVVDPTRHVVRLIHYTAQHYLDRIRECRFPHAQTEITVTGIAYLYFDRFANPSPPRHDQGEECMSLPMLLNIVWYTLAESPNCLSKRGSQDSGPGLPMERFLPGPLEFWPLSASRLWIASQFNLWEIARHLLAHGAPVNDEDRERESHCT
ncbi:hypothetical protein B0H10DRAFT_281427 [Mycena sp. CBHHK59/15]|nr:hypothetical protein B0H10DRAFT_281427 [Mycena sp. CBHHK59/15]